MGYGVWSITVVGLLTVFSVFVILFVVFKSFELFSAISKKRKKGRKVFESVEIAVEEDEEVVAAIFGALSLFNKEKNFKIKNVKKINERGWTYWRKTGWKGVKKWSRNIE